MELALPRRYILRHLGERNGSSMDICSRHVTLVACRIISEVDMINSDSSDIASDIASDSASDSLIVGGPVLTHSLPLPQARWGLLAVPPTVT